MREWTDEKTGRTVRQLTDSPGGAYVGYFRQPRHLPGGRILARELGPPGRPIAVDPETGEVEPLPDTTGTFITSGAHGEWFVVRPGEEIWSLEGPTDPGRRLGALPQPHPGQMVALTCDGQHAILGEFNYPPGQDLPPPTSKNPADLWRFFNRPRSGKMWVCHLPSGALREILAIEGRLFIHHDPSPVDPTLLRFAHDYYDAYCQRIWLIRIDGSQLRPVRPQERGEFITHEFWWPGGQYIAFKYQDRRNDPTIESLPWGEYSPVPTQVGLADTTGRQVYLSDPINHYHSHIYVSRDGSLLCGEGTEGHSFVYAARFSMQSTKVEFVPHATIHTPYLPFAVGQQVNSGFSHDNRWLIYNDTVEGKLQVCAVQVEV